LTRTGRNRAAANPRENFMITQKKIFLQSQGETRRDGLSKVGPTCVKTDDLLSWAKWCKERDVVHHVVNCGQASLDRQARNGTPFGCSLKKSEICSDRLTPGPIYRIHKRSLLSIHENLLASWLPTHLSPAFPLEQVNTTHSYQVHWVWVPPNARG
jgi:hypothetical protein